MTRDSLVSSKLHHQVSVVSAGEITAPSGKSERENALFRVRTSSDLV